MEQSCAELLGILLQAVAHCETWVEQARVALNDLPFYSPQIMYFILSKHCDDEIMTQGDLVRFMDEWKVKYTETSLKGLFMDFCPHRNLFEYEDFLLLTMPSSLAEKKEIKIAVSELSDDISFKLETSFVLFLVKEIKYQSEVENRRLDLFEAFRVDPMELFKMIDGGKKGYIDYADTRQFMRSIGLEFETIDWDNIVFRTKKSRSSNPVVERIYFTEFHDLLYPITYFENIGRSEIINWNLMGRKTGVDSEMMHAANHLNIDMQSLLGSKLGSQSYKPPLDLSSFDDLYQVTPREARIEGVEPTIYTSENLDFSDRPNIPSQHYDHRNQHFEPRLVTSHPPLHHPGYLPPHYGPPPPAHSQWPRNDRPYHANRVAQDDLTSKFERYLMHFKDRDAHLYG